MLHFRRRGVDFRAAGEGEAAARLLGVPLGGLLIGESTFPFERVETVGVGAGFFDFAAAATRFFRIPKR